MPTKTKPRKPSSTDVALLPGMGDYEPDVVVAAKHHMVTGTTAIKDADRVERIVSDIVGGLSHTEVCRRHKVGWRTVDAIMQHAEDTGKVTGLKEKLMRSTSAAALMAWDRVNTHLAEGREPEQGTCIVAGISTDKTVTLSGWQPTTIVQVNVGVAVSVDLEDELADLRRLYSPAASQSVGASAQPPAIIDVPSSVSISDAGHDTVRPPAAGEIDPSGSRRAGSPGGGGVTSVSGTTDDVAFMHGDQPTKEQS